MQVVMELRPTALIGAASIQGAFTQETVERLTTGIQQPDRPLVRPVVMALSNPLTRSECTAEEAISWSGGAAVFASGTQFGPVKKKSGEEVVSSQANNSLIFPGIGMGCLASGGSPPPLPTDETQTRCSLGNATLRVSSGTVVRLNPKAVLATSPGHLRLDL